MASPCSNTAQSSGSKFQHLDSKFDALPTGSIQRHSSRNQFVISKKMNNTIPRILVSPPYPHVKSTIIRIYDLMVSRCLSAQIATLGGKKSPHGFSPGIIKVNNQTLFSDCTAQLSSRNEESWIPYLPIKNLHFHMYPTNVLGFKKLKSSDTNLIAYLTHLCVDIKHWWGKNDYE